MAAAAAFCTSLPIAGVEPRLIGGDEADDWSSPFKFSPGDKSIHNCVTRRQTETVNRLLT